MDQLRQDLRYGFRSLRKNPGFTAVAVLSLGLGIGANTAIFSLVNTVMLRLLPVAKPERLVLMTNPASSGVAIDTTEGGVRRLLSYPEFDRLRQHNRVFTGMAAMQSAPGDLDIRIGAGDTGPQIKARGQLVSGEFFPVLGLTPAAGRLFTPADDKLGEKPVAVLSYGFWQREFGRDPSVAGKTFRVGRAVVEVIGVAPPSFRGVSVGAEPAVWFPIAFQEQILPGRRYLHAHDTLWLQVMGRLKDDMSRDAAQAGINVSFQQILNEWPGYARNEIERRGLVNQRLELRDGSKGTSSLRGQFSDPLVLLMGMVGLVLLIACANIANLMLARAMGRQREIGVRLALGAGRGKLIRQQLTESLVVACMGGVLGMLFAVWGADLLITMVAGTPQLLHVHYDLRVFVFTAAVSLATGVLFGILPALRATRVDINRTLSATRAGSGARSTARTGRTLVVVQVCLSLTLLVAAILLGRSLHNLFVQSLGYERERLYMAHVDLRGAADAARPAFYQQVLDKFHAIPGVRGASLSDKGLFGGDSGDRISFDVAVQREAKQMGASWDQVGANYFSTLGVPILRGREIKPDDVARRAPVCVINDTMAKFFFPNSDPIGRRLTNEYPTTRVTYEIVGVSADVRDHRLRGTQERRFYSNIALPMGAVDEALFLLRTAGEPPNLASAVRQALAAVDGTVSLLSVRSVSEQIDRRLVMERLMAHLSTFFGALALLLSAIGLYGVMSYSVTLRTSEIGLRMALGAEKGRVVWMVLRQTLWMVAIGIGIGLPCAIAAARLITNRLFGLSPADPVSMAGAILVIVAAAVFAGYLPARRAARVDPIQALRYE